MSNSPLHDRSTRSVVSRWLLGLGLGLLGTTALQAQSLNYTAAGASNVAGTYTDLGTSGTVITTSSTDDALSAAQALPFSFGYNGATFTDFSLSTNGFIKLGTTPLSAANLLNAIGSANAADVNIIAPLSNVDLQTSTAGTAEYRYATTGTAPNRVTTIQWKNVADKLSTSAPAQFTSMQFQVKLYETSNRVEFVYGTWVANAATPTGQPFVVGLKGSSNVAADRLFAEKGSSLSQWSTTTFSPGTTQLLAHFVRNTVLPDAGRTYRFNPASANDAGVAAIYTLGKVSSVYNSPVTVQARIRNTGSSAQTNLPVTLTVSGATTFTNTQTVASLAAGASTTVTFAAYPVTGTTGTNTITVNVPADDATGNDSKTYSQLITANDQSYIDSSQPLNPTGVGVGSVNGMLVVRQHTNTPAVVTSITPTFVTATGASTTYQVVVYDATGTGGTPGAALYTSPTQTRPASGPAVVAVPNIAVNGDFFIGTKELDANNIVIGYQVESPLKPATYYFFTTTANAWTDVNQTTLETRLALEVGLSPAATGTCNPVTALAVGSITDNTASVSFTPGTGASGYTVTYTAAGGQPVTVNATGSPVALTGLTAGTAYTVTVTANCTAGGTSAPATATFTTTGNSCASVTGATISNITGYSALLTFTPAAGAVDYDVDVTGGPTPIGGTIPTSPATIPGLTPNTTYTVTIITNCASGTSAPTTVTFTTGAPAPTPANDDCANRVTLTPGAAGAACNPTNGTVTAASQSIGPIQCAGFTAEFAQDVWYQFTATFTEHTITTDGGFDGVLEVLTGTCATPINFACGDASTQNGEVLRMTNLTVGTTYLVRYYPYLENQDPTDGAFTICVTTPANATVCSPVTGLTVTGITATSASVNFTPGAGNTGYTVTYTRAGQPAQTVTPAPTASPVLLSGLTPSASYTVSVTPVCAAGGSAPAVTANFTTPLGTRAALAGGFVSVFPNPAHQSFTVAIPAVSGARSAQVAIINTLGQVVRTQAVSLSATATQATVDAANLAAGIYTVRVKAGNETANVRLTIQ